MRTPVEVLLGYFRRSRATVVLLAAMAAGAAFFLWNRAHPTVWVLNPFDEQIEVRIGAKVVTVTPHGRASTEVPTGPATVVVSRGTQVLETTKVTVPAGADAAIYNPFGAAPLFLVGVHYSFSRPKEGSEGDFGYLGGRPWVVVEHANYVFEQPPESIQSSSYLDDVRSLITTVGDGSWRSSAAWLYEHERTQEILTLQRALGALAPEMFQIAFVAARERGLDEVIAFEKDEMAKGETYDLLRQYQRDRRAHDGIVSVRKEFAERALRDPGAESRLLLARVDERESAERALRSLVTDGTWGPAAKKVLAYRLSHGERWSEVEDLLGPKPDPVYLDVLLQALVRQGKNAQALALLEEYVADKDAPAIVLVEAAKELDPSSSRAEKLIGQLKSARKGFDGARVDLVRVVAGLPVDEAAPKAAPTSRTERMYRDAILLTKVALKDPDRARSLLTKSPSPSLLGVDPRLALLLLAEHHRLGGDNTVRLLLAAAQRQSTLPAPAIFRFVDEGEDSEDLREADADERAAVLLVRARKLEAEGRDGSGLRSEARRLAALGGPIAQAIRNWPRASAPAKDGVDDVPVVFVRVSASAARAMPAVARAGATRPD